MSQGEQIKYDAWVDCAGISERTKVIFDEKCVMADSLFSQEIIDYTEIKDIRLEDYNVFIYGESKQMRCSRMGQQCEWFYRELAQQYNKKVLKSFGVTGAAEFETKGVYEYECHKGRADIKIFEDCICILPTNLEARRIPFVFLNGLQKEEYALSLKLVTGENYRFSMMGRDMEPFINKVTEKIRAEREKERLVARPVNADLKKRLLQSKIKSTYPVMERILDCERMYIGVKRLTDVEFEQILAKLENPEELSDEQKEEMRWIVWSEIPTRDKTKVIVEFSIPNEAAATYVFRVKGEWERYIHILNRGLEATHLGREEFSLSDEQIRKHDNSKMLIERTPAIQMIRRNFEGKVIHRSVGQWESNLKELL